MAWLLVPDGLTAIRTVTVKLDNRKIEKSEYWHKQHVSLDLSYLVSLVQADGGGAGGRDIFQHTLGTL